MSRKGSQQTQRELSLEALSCKVIIHHGETGRVVQYRVLEKRKKKQISCKLNSEDVMVAEERCYLTNQQMAWC